MARKLGNSCRKVAACLKTMEERTPGLEVGEGLSTKQPTASRQVGRLPRGNRAYVLVPTRAPARRKSEPAVKKNEEFLGLINSAGAGRGKLRQYYLRLDEMESRMREDW